MLFRTRSNRDRRLARRLHPNEWLPSLGGAEYRENESDMIPDERHTPKSTEQVAAYVDGVASVLNIAINSEHRPGVVANMERLLELGHLVMRFPLPEDTKVAPVFQP
jgi:hypothetical protein